LLASYRVWSREAQTVAELTESDSVSIDVREHGCFVDNRHRRYLVLPDVFIVNRSKTRNASVDVELSGSLNGQPFQCPFESNPLSDWENRDTEFRRKHADFPMNLSVEQSRRCYIAFLLENTPVRDYFCAVVTLRRSANLKFVDRTTNKTLWQQEIKFERTI
jgi:hypothetical protein